MDYFTYLFKKNLISTLRSNFEMLEKLAEKSDLFSYDISLCKYRKIKFEIGENLQSLDYRELYILKQRYVDKLSLKEIAKTIQRRDKKTGEIKEDSAKEILSNIIYKIVPYKPLLIPGLDI